MKIILLNKTTDSRLAEVRAEMQTLGAPVIECFELEDGKYLATEGSHRLTAAKELGLIPTVVVIDKLDKDDPDTENFYVDASGVNSRVLSLNSRLLIMGETPFSNFVQDLQNLLNRYGACITVQADEVTSKPCVYLSMQLEPNVSIGWGFNRLPVVKNVEDR